MRPRLNNMVNKEHILNFLRVNEIPYPSPEEDIRRALGIARWHDDDIQVALLKLRNDSDPYQYNPNNARNIFFSDIPIAPETLSSLLGVNISLPRARLRAQNSRANSKDTLTTTVTLLTVFTSVVLGLFVTLFVMYLYNVGPFYTPVENFVF